MPRYADWIAVAASWSDMPGTKRGGSDTCESESESEVCVCGMCVCVCFFGGRVSECES